MTLRPEYLALLCDLVKRRLLDLDYAGSTLDAKIERGRLDQCLQHLLHAWADSYRTVAP